MSGAYYNEFDPYAAQWLRNLIAKGLIASGDVDERSIEDVFPDDVKGYTQCHFFAGIGVWSYALRNSGWGDDRPVWTGSCPCQPFSAAGKGVAFDDERHLWPAFHHLIGECRPTVIFGEQVASKDADAWIDLVQDDLEGMGYAVGSIPFPAAGVGAPHIRDRMYWVAYADYSGLERWGRVQECSTEFIAREGGLDYGLADSNSQQRDWRRGFGPRRGLEHSDGGAIGECTPAGSTNGHWRDADWLFCRDGRWRPVEPGTSPLAHGSPARVGRLRAYGNAIVAQAAQAFIESIMKCMP